MTLFIGAPGSGKTTLCAYFSKQFYKDKKNKDKTFFSNVPILNTTKIVPNDDLGNFLIEDGCVCIDEGGIEYNNRNFANLPKSVIKFAKLYRHYGIKSFLFFSQGMDIDVTFIRLCDRIVIVKKSIIPYFVFTREVRKVIGIDELTHQLVDMYKFKFLGFHFVFMPSVWKLFDTYETPPLPFKQFPLWDYTNRFNDTEHNS